MTIIRSHEEFEAVRGSWEPLADRLENPFVGHDWLLSCVERFHEPGDLRIVLVDGPGGVVAAAPLVAVRRNGYERLELIGSSAMLEPSGLLYADQPSLALLVRSLVGLGQPILLRGIDADGATLAALRTALARTRDGVVLTHGARTSLTLPIHLPWPAFVRSMSAKMRQDVRRFQARADAMGRTTFEILAPAPSDVPGLMETLVEAERAGWTARTHTGLAYHERLRAFYQAFAVRAAGRGRLRVIVMRIAGRAAAVQFSIEAYRRLWLLAIGFDETFARCSPGFLVMHHSIRMAHERQLAALEFLGNAADWQRRWHPEERQYISAMAVPMTARALSGLVMDVIDRCARRLRPALPGGRHS